jgi:hypothetical protein
MILTSITLTLFVPAAQTVKAVDIPSPTARTEYKLVVRQNRGGSGYYTVKVDKDNQKIYKLIAHPKNGYGFIKWTIKGRYKIIKGNLKSKTLSIMIYSDCVATPFFRDKKTGKQVTTTVKTNSSPVSPKTGEIKPYMTPESNSNNAMIEKIIAIALLSFAGLTLLVMIILTIKHIKKNRDFRKRGF